MGRGTTRPRLRRHRRRHADVRRARASQRRAGRALRRPRSGQGHARRRADDQRHRVAGGGVRRQSSRRDRGAAQHVPPSARARGAAPDRGRRAPGPAGRVPRARLRRRPHGDLARAGHRHAAHGRCGAAAPHHHRVGGTRRRGRRAAATRPRCWARRCGPTGRRSRDRLHVGESRHTEGCHPHARRRARGHRVRARRAPAHARRPPLHPDAVLLGGRLRDRAALRPGRGGDPPHRGAAGTGAHAAIPRTQPGHALPRLARSGCRARS